MKTWRLKSHAVDEVVVAADQFEAWDTLRDRPLEHFGLVVTAEPNESADPIPVRTSLLMFRWGRDADAEQLIALAIQSGLGDTTEADRRFGAAA